MTSKWVIMIIHDGEAVGDKNQSIGIATALLDFKTDKWEIECREYSTKTYSLEELSKQIDALMSEESMPVLISAGLSGLHILHNLKRIFPDVKSIWSGHQVFKEVETLFSFSPTPDLMAFPIHQEAHIPDFLRKKTLLKLTDGVPHNVSERTIKSDQEMFLMRNGALPEFLAPSVVIILPGDAPDESGIMKVFTPEDACLLAEKIYANYSDFIFVVTNGPRTGKYLDPLHAHRDGEVDKVTQAFLDKLSELSSRAPILYDFQFSRLPSAYKPLLHAVKTSKGTQLLCPGESTSMVTETLGYLPRQQVVIMEIPEVMNEAHKGHLSEVEKMGGVRVLKVSGKIEVGAEPRTEFSGETAAMQIAKEFFTTMISHEKGSKDSFVMRATGGDSGGAASQEDNEPA